MVSVDPRQDMQRQDIQRQNIQRQGVMVGATLTMGHIYGGTMGAILAKTNVVVCGMARTAAKRVRDYFLSAQKHTTPYLE